MRKFLPFILITLIAVALFIYPLGYGLFKDLQREGFDYYPIIYIVSFFATIVLPMGYSLVSLLCAQKVLNIWGRLSSVIIGWLSFPACFYIFTLLSGFTALRIRSDIAYFMFSGIFAIATIITVPLLSKKD